MIGFQSTPRVERAITEARRIRRNMVRLRGERMLTGDCWIASLLLAHALGSPESLRYTEHGFIAHVFNRVDRVIIDVTATQFADDISERGLGRGVLITRHREMDLGD